MPIDLQALTEKWREDQLHEEYVHAVWKDYGPMTYGRFDICDMEGDMNWQAAAEFTADSCEEIRQLEEEILYINNAWPPFVASGYEQAAMIIQRRILARLQSALEELKQGMRSSPHVRQRGE